MLHCIGVFVNGAWNEIKLVRVYNSDDQSIRDIKVDEAKELLKRTHINNLAIINTGEWRGEIVAHVMQLKWILGTGNTMLPVINQGNKRGRVCWTVLNIENGYLISMNQFGERKYLTKEYINSHNVHFANFDQFIYEGKYFNKNLIAIPDAKETLPENLRISINFESDINVKLSLLNSPFRIDDAGNLVVYNIDRILETGIVEIPIGCTEIIEGQFKSIWRIEEVTIPRSVKIIKEKAFEMCGGLKRLQLSKGLEVIEKQAFCGCNDLEEIILPHGLKRIGTKAFYSKAPAVKEIYIPETVETIRKDAFSISKNKKGINITLPEKFASPYELDRIGLGNALGNPNVKINIIGGTTK